MTGIRILRLQIDRTIPAARYHQSKARDDTFALLEKGQEGWVTALGTLPLSDVEIFVADSYLLFRGPNMSQREVLDSTWTEQDRVEYAEKIRQRLLDPKGVEHSRSTAKGGSGFPLKK